MTAGGTAEFELTVTTWNVQRASELRSRRQAEWLAYRDFTDVLILTEVGANADAIALADCLRSRGYETCTPPAPGDRTVLIASRVGPVTAVDDGYTGRLAHRALAATIELPDGRECGVVGVYVPSRGPNHRRNVDKRAFQADFAAALPSILKGFDARVPVIVGGDLNVVAMGHRPHHPVFAAWEYEFYDAFGHAGLVDAWSHLHTDDDADTGHSWYGLAGRGYRFDHLFITAAHAHDLVDAQYVQEPRAVGLSDHAAHTATLRLHPPR